MRVRGALLVLCGALLSGFGAWLLYLTMGWAYPAFVPPGLVPQGVALAVDGPPLTSLPGLASLLLIGMGAAFGILGLGMFILGQRSRTLYNVALAFFVIYAAAVVWVVLSPGA